MEDMDKTPPRLELQKKTKKAHIKKKSTGVWLGVVVITAVVLFAMYYRHESLKPAQSFPISPEWVRYLKVSNVYDVKRDPYEKDKVWFATAEGVRLYNKSSGYWYSFGIHNGLLSEQVTSIECDSQRVWFGTWAGVNYYDRKTGAWHRLKKGDRLKSRKVLDIKRDGQYLWVSSSKYLERYNIQTDEWKRFGSKQGLKSGEIYSITADRNNIYGGSNKGILYIYNKKKQTWSEKKNSKSSSFVTKIWAVERFGEEIWTGTSHTGVWQYNTVTGKWRTHRQGSPSPLIMVYSVFIDSSTVWAGTPIGINRYDKKNDVWIRVVADDPLTKKPYIVTALEGDDGFIWFGTYGKGIGKCLKNQLGIIQCSGGMEHDHVCALGVDTSHLWLGYGFIGGYADYIRKDSLVWEKNINLNEGIPAPEVSVIRCWNDVVFIGTWRGFAVYNRAAKKWMSSREEMLFDGEVKCVQRVGKVFYIGTNDGLFMYPEGGKSVAYVKGSEDNSVLAMGREDSLLWVGTKTNGLRCLNVISGKWQDIDILKNKKNVSGVAVFNGSVWFASSNKGIYSYKKTDSLSYIPFDEMGELEKQEKRTPEITELKVIGKRLWIATNHGICVLDKNKRYTMSYKTGLINNDVLTLSEDKIYVYIGFFGGLNKVKKSYLEKTIFKR